MALHLKPLRGLGASLAQVSDLCLHWPEPAKLMKLLSRQFLNTSKGLLNTSLISKISLDFANRCIWGLEGWHNSANLPYQYRSKLLHSIDYRHQFIFKMFLFGDITTLIALRYFVSLTSEELFIPNLQHSRKIQQLVTPLFCIFILFQSYLLPDCSTLRTIALVTWLARS